jgi:hypothetical protein
MAVNQVTRCGQNDGMGLIECGTGRLLDRARDGASSAERRVPRLSTAMTWNRVEYPSSANRSQTQRA